MVVRGIRFRAHKSCRTVYSPGEAVPESEVQNNGVTGTAVRDGYRDGVWCLLFRTIVTSGVEWHMLYAPKAGLE